MRTPYTKKGALQDADVVVPPALLKRWSQCPLRGRRAHELVDFLCEFEDRSLPLSANILAELPSEMVRADKDMLLQEYESGRVWLKFYLQLKLGHLQSVPHVFYRFAHSDVGVRNNAIRMALDTPHRGHPLAKLFGEGGQLRELALRMLNGDDSQELWESSLGHMIGCLRFVPITEADAEGQHAVTHRHASKAPNHSEQYISFRQRRHHLESECSTCEDIGRFALIAKLVSNPSKAVEVLGLAQHPSILDALQSTKGEQDMVRRATVYHADARTLYTTAVAELPLRQLFAEPGDHPDPAEGKMMEECDEVPEASSCFQHLFYDYAARYLKTTASLVQADENTLFCSPSTWDVAMTGLDAQTCGCAASWRWR